METQLIEIREQQKATWNKFSPGWKKWDDFSAPVGVLTDRNQERQFEMHPF